MLEQLTLPIDYEDFDVDKSEVSVALTVTDPFSWIPTNPHDTTWDGIFKRMLEMNCLCQFQCLFYFQFFKKVGGLKSFLWSH